ncbi:MAG: DUF2167 domain-containing protein [Chitinophagaceae bacterium]
MKKLLLPLFLLLASFVSFAKNDEDSTAIMVAKYLKYRDSVEQALKYETGTIKLSGDMVTLNVPKGFKYLNKEQSNFVLTNLWGNPPQDYVLGMLFPEKGGPLRDTSYAFVISFDEIGYVKDEDADKIDYSKMLKDQQEEEPKENAERVKQGYDPIHFIGWAQQPFYDKENKTLHWAKELHFGAADDSGSNTLNYDVRILGRKGVLSLNAVGTMDNLDLVKNDIGQVLHIATFTDGNKYSDFDPGVDKVAAWTIGGLVAGKVLAKVGILAVLGKFFVAAWKFIVIGIVAAWGAIMKFFKRKKPEDEVVYEPAPVEPEPVQDTATSEETNA